MTFHTDAGPQAAASFWVARTVGTDTTRENEVARDSQNSHDGRRSSTHRMTSTDAGHVSRLLLLQAVSQPDHLPGVQTEYVHRAKQPHIY